MFVIIGKKRCPSCGIKGEKWKKKPEVFVCKKCNSFYNEFGIVLESQTQEEEEIRFA